MDTYYWGRFKTQFRNFLKKNRATGLRAINIVFQEAELAKGLEHLRSGRCQATFLGWIKISGVVEFYSAWNE